MTDSDCGADQAAVGEVLMKLAAGFRSLDASGLDGVYAQDADWTNAFGMTKHGRDEIVSYLEVLFADEHFGAGRLVGPPQVSIRFLGDDVAVVKATIRHSESRVERRHGVTRTWFSQRTSSMPVDTWLSHTSFPSSAPIR